MYVVCWYVHADTFLELDSIDLTVLTAVPQDAAEGDVTLGVNDPAAHSMHWDRHHQCSEQSVGLAQTRVLYTHTCAACSTTHIAPGGYSRRVS